MRSPLRIVHLITDLNVGGAEMMLSRLVDRLDSSCFESIVVCLGSGGPVADRIRERGIAVYALSSRPTLFTFGRLFQLLRRLQPDVLQTWLYHADLVGLLAGRLTHVPHVTWNIRCAELDPRDHRPSLAFVLRGLALTSRWPSAVICNSHAGRRAHERLGYSPRRWVVIPNGFDIEMFHPDPAAGQHLRRQLSIADDVLLAGRLARFHAMKDYPNLVRAAAIVAHTRGDIHFVLAGRGVPEDAGLQRLVAELQLTGRVHLLPERSDSPSVMAALDVAVSSSAYGEGFPNVIGEAMACGTPCVATDVGDSALIVGDCGRVVPPRNPEAMAAGILEILAMDRSEREALGRAARQRIASEFSLERITHQYARFYEQLVGAGPIESTCVA